MNPDTNSLDGFCCQEDRKCSIAVVLASLSEDVTRNKESLAEIIEFLKTKNKELPSSEKSAFTIAEFAAITDKSKFTVAEKCREGRLHADKTHTGRGGKPEWRISRDELVRYQIEGWLPINKGN